jgi:hypothetical protein
MDKFITKELARFDATIKEADLTALVDKYSGLLIDGVEDKNGYRAVHDARIILKTKRVEISKIGKDLRASANAFAAAVIERENELIEIISPTEKELMRREDEVDEERDRIRIEKENAENERVQSIVDSLRKFGCEVDYTEAKGMTPEQFEERMKESHLAWQFKKEQEELERKELKAKQIQEEQDRIRLQKANEEERLRLAKIQEEQDRRQRELDEQQRKILEDRRNIEHAQHIEEAKRQAAEKALKEKEIADRVAEEDRIEKLNEAPDSEKLAQIQKSIKVIFESNIWSNFKSKSGIRISQQVSDHLKEALTLCKLKK